MDENEIRKMVEKNDGSIAKALEEYLGGKVIAEEDFEYLLNVFGQAMNNGKCPCGSGKAYKDCCKANWQVFSRSYKRRVEEIIDKAKEEIKEKKKEMKETEWLAMIGVKPNGEVDVKPLVDEKGNVKNISFRDMASLLMEAWSICHTNMIMHSTHIQMEAMLKNLVDRVGTMETKNPTKLQTFGGM